MVRNSWLSLCCSAGLLVVLTSDWWGVPDWLMFVAGVFVIVGLAIAVVDLMRQVRSRNEPAAAPDVPDAPR